MLTFASFIITRATSIANHFPIFLSFVTLTCQYRFLHQTTFHRPSLLRTLCRLCIWAFHVHVAILYRIVLNTSSRLAKSYVHSLALCCQSNHQNTSSSRSRYRLLYLISNSYGTLPSRLSHQRGRTCLCHVYSLRSIHPHTQNHRSRLRDHNHVEHHFATGQST